MAVAKRLARAFLWVSVLAGGILLGAKIFDLVVLAGAWSASPPKSLRLLPYGSNYPVDTEIFFGPSSALLLISSVGAIISAWRSPLWFRILLTGTALSIFSILILTVLVFWPLDLELWAYAQDPAASAFSAAEIVSKAQTWVRLDWLRVAVATIGFVCSVRAISIPYPDNRVCADHPAVPIVYVGGLISVAAFVFFFVSNISAVPG